LGTVFEALAVLDLYPQGLELGALAALIDVDPQTLRTDLIAYNAGTDLGPEGLTAWVEFLSRLPEAAEFEPDEAPEDEAPDDDAQEDDLYVPGEQAVAVRLHNPGAGVPGQAGGLTVSDIGQVLGAAEDLARVEPENVALAQVIAQVRSLWLPGVTDVWRPSLQRRFEAELTSAIADRRRVRITYDRTWRPGIVERIIEPYALVRTQRGFEVDAGPVQPDGRIRTYLVDQIVRMELLAEGFDAPADVEGLCAANRLATTVLMVIPADRAWVAEFLAEQVEVLSADDDVHVKMSVIEPLRDRVGLVLLQAGPGAFVTEPAQLADADDELARRLLAHHGLRDDEVGGECDNVCGN
jgi:proteasome accessory factor C